MNYCHFVPPCLRSGTLLILASTFVASVQAQPSISSSYDFVRLEYPGAQISYPLGINSFRRIVGVWIDANNVSHGYLYSHHKFTSIDYPGAPQVPYGGTVTGGINDFGDIAGTFSDAQGFQHGFVLSMPPGCNWDPGDRDCKPEYHQIDVPGAVQTTGIDFELGPGLGTDVAGINDAGEISGGYATPGLYSNGFKLSRGKYIPIDDPAATHLPGLGSRTFALNNFGVVVGAYETQASPAAYPTSGGFLFDGHKFTSVFVLNSDQGGFGTQANGVNDFGEVVGLFSDPAGNAHGLFWIDGISFAIDYPGQPYTECHSINNRGDITGAYLADPSGYNYVGFVAYPKKDR